MKDAFQKFVLLLTLCIAFSFSAQAQHFDWVKSYTGPKYQGSDYHMPMSSVIDAEGNLYVLGRFVSGARMDTTYLLPITGSIKVCTWIAKFTPSGELAWHKAIYAQQSHCVPHDIRCVGDSAIMVMASIFMPHYSIYGQMNNPVYYLDTLYTTSEGLMATDSMRNMNITSTAFITLDYDGNVEEQHFLQLGYVDSTGATLRACNTGGAPGDSSIVISPMGFSTEMFNLDDEGNIYVCRRAMDFHGWYTSDGEYRELSVENGGIGALRIMVDGVRSLYWPVSYRSDRMNQQILEFSPHFDTLLDGFYVFDSLDIPEDVDSYIDVTAFERDASGNLYLVLGGYDYPDSMRLSRSDTLLCLSSDRVAFDACVIAYNSELIPYQVFQITSTPNATDQGYWIHNVTYDEETGSLFLLATVQKNFLGYEDTSRHVTYRGDTLELNNNLFWLRVDPVNGHLLSYGKARSTGRTSLVNSQGDGQCLQANLAVKNNRVFAQVSYQVDIFCRETRIPGPQIGFGMGVMCWDTEGHDIEFIDYGAEADFGNRPGLLHITDSSLWLTGIVAIGADFGSHHVYPAGADQAYIAHYTDTAFMTPYLFVDPRIKQAIEWNQELSFALTGTPITLTATATSGLPVTYTCADTTIARVSGSQLHLLSVGTTTVTAHQDGTLYGFYPASPVTKTLIVSTAANIDDISIFNSQFSIYPNPTTGKVSITTSDPIVSAILTDMMGRREEVRLIPQADGRYSLDLTSRFNAVYLLSLTTNDGRQHTVRLLKQSDIFAK